MPLHEVVHMGGMGLLVSVAAPALVLATRDAVSWRALSWPAPIALPFFVSLHGLLMFTMERSEPPWTEHLVLDALLTLAAVVFWLPVLGRIRPLHPSGQVIYLFLAAPALDLAGVVLVATGNGVGGLAMIVGMLPIGGIAVAITWRWVHDEEAVAQQLDLLDPPEVRHANA